MKYLLPSRTPGLYFDRVICATSPVELILLTGSRISAGVLYPSIVISIFSKCYATRSYLHHSWLGAVLEFEPTHDVHTCECREIRQRFVPGAVVHLRASVNLLCLVEVVHAHI